MMLVKKPSDIYQTKCFFYCLTLCNMLSYSLFFWSILSFFHIFLFPIYLSILPVKDWSADVIPVVVVLRANGISFPLAGIQSICRLKICKKGTE